MTTCAEATDASDLKSRLKAKPNQLSTIYEQQMEFCRFHNGLVWQVSTIFIPFSFAGLALEFGNATQFNFVALGSSLVLLIWTALTEWHRWTWVHSMYVAAMVEHIWGYRDLEPASPRFFSNHAPCFVGLSITTSPIPGFLDHFDWGRLLRLSFGALGIVFWIVRWKQGIGGDMETVRLLTAPGECVGGLMGGR
jgi:hypothetical protein